jgi:hypothetical protein
MDGKASAFLGRICAGSGPASSVCAVGLRLPVLCGMTSIPEGTRRRRIFGPLGTRLRRWRACRLLAVVMWYLIPGSRAAFAHVKWFSAYNISAQPIPLRQVISGTFGMLVALTLIVLFAATSIFISPVGIALQHAMARLTRPIRNSTEKLLRAVYGAFFITLWARGGIILTPELTTTAAWISWLQLLIAAGMLWRQTLLFSGLGIVALFGIATFNYGLFHLLDYPIFLGASAYFILVGTGWSPFGVRPLDVARYATAVTLMWASIEKWAYPQWSYPIFVAHPEISLGFNIAFYMKAAGIVEFALAFALVWPPLARSAAIVLCGMFVGAIFEFGKIDAIGHAPIIVILVVVLADDALAARARPALAPAWCALAIAGFVAAYYIGHAALFGTAIL